ncbi:MAG TPA: DUF4136 domain-containing protein [Gammaproteobacteria bacterium]|nr:DUF4136 domain-containing protein [Gammaproteobacteria bacterium]
MLLRYLWLSVASLTLIGCQASNPYQAEGLPLPPAPAAAATYFDTSAYPAPTKFKTYTYWCWHNQDPSQAHTVYTHNTAHSILAEQLEQYGLRPAALDRPCELKVQLSSQQGQRVRHNYYDHPYPSANFGYGYSGRHSYHDRYRHSGVGVNFPMTARSYTEHYQQFSIYFTDAQTGQTVWQGQSAVSSDQHAQTSEQAVRTAINEMLGNFRQTVTE